MLPYHGDDGFLRMPIDVEEYQDALRLALKACFNVVNGLEIGLGWGASAQAFLMANPEAKLFSYDINGSLPAGKILSARYPHRFVYLTGNNVEGLWADNLFDWIYIDGGHGVLEVKRDLNNYYPKLKDGGVLCLDDYDNSCCPGVRIAVDEFVEETGLEMKSCGGPTGIVYFIKPSELIGE
jgi:predicted O-methyltransferase YrrM